MQRKAHNNKEILIKKPLKMLVYIASILIIAALAFLIIMYIFQDSLLFMTNKTSFKEHELLKAKYPFARDITIETPDKTILSGWFVKSSSEGKSPLLIHFDGNADLASDILKHRECFEGWSILSVNYRGYGLSQGKPSQTALFSDALCIYDKYSRNQDIDNRNIVVMGYSLGTAVATHVACNRHVKAVILTAPFDSVTRIVQDKLPFLPVSRLVNHPLDSLSCAPLINAPLYTILAERDLLIPRKNSMNLIKAWKGVSKTEIIPKKGHSSMLEDEQFWNCIKAYMKSLKT